MRDQGLIIINDPGADRALNEIATAKCVHCGGHFPIQPGSGKLRGFCTRCNGPICGPKCANCVPEEQLLENLEAFRPADYRPIRAPVRLPKALREAMAKTSSNTGLSCDRFGRPIR